MKKNQLLSSTLILLLFLLCYSCRQNVQSTKNAESQASVSPKVPFIGAQVFIEPGQTREEIDTWFRLLKENGFSVCRIRMFESYMKRSDGNYDFTLFDNAFISAEKYGISVFGTIFPQTDKTDIGGFKFPRDDAHIQSIASFIKALTQHFSQFKSLRGWVLINEPGTLGLIPWTDFTKKKYNEWLLSHPVKEFTANGYPVLVNLQDQAFLYDYNTWYLRWLAEEITKYDNSHELHVNNHEIFQNCAEYNFPEWRKFLTSLGGSAHAAWHFSYFTREKYTVAMSANCEIIRSGAGNIPWFMTELQGGNNTYSGRAPMCPTKEEISQWLWTIIVSEGRGGIFWTLNPRSSGIESGEWALLDFQNNPSDRMIAASGVSAVVNRHPELFENCKEAESGIDILYVRQSLWAEKKMAIVSSQDYEGRKSGAVIKSALGYFEALSEMGINAGFKAFEEYNFGEEDYSGKTIILSNQISMPALYAPVLENFVKKGGKLIVDGLTAFFDENLQNIMKTGFPFRELLGGKISEFKLVDKLFGINYDGYEIPAHIWRGTINNKSGEVLATYDGMPVATRNRIGKGEVIWIPSLIGLGSRIKGDYSSLQKFITSEALHSIEKVPVRFMNPKKDWIMKSVISGSSIITVVINKSGKKDRVELRFINRKLKPALIYRNASGRIRGNKITLLPEETMVIAWS